MSNSTLAQAIAWIAEDEGAELNVSPDEPGGSSKYGVTMEQLRVLHKRRNLPPPTMADMKRVDVKFAGDAYTELYAVPIRYNDFNAGIDYRLLDASVSAGITGGAWILEDALGHPRQYEPDGSRKLSKMTDALISEANAIDPAVLIPKIGAAWLAHKMEAAKGSTKYKAGWTNRGNKVQPRALSLITKPQPQEPTMSSWRVAHSLETLLKQVNALAPHRRKSDDGTIGDAAHASRTSDHNPYIRVGNEGVVRALDVTHAPESGFDAYAYAEVLRKNRDPRIRYIISNYKIAYGKGHANAWEWQPYRVPPNLNPHNHHTHVSVTEKESEFDDPTPWNLNGMDAEVEAQAPVANNYVAPPTTLRLKARGELVKKMQAGIGLTGAAVDGFFGPNTEKALKAFQTAHGLGADGICGPQTWKAIG